MATKCRRDGRTSKAKAEARYKLIVAAIDAEARESGIDSVDLGIGREWLFPTNRGRWRVSTFTSSGIPTRLLSVFSRLETEDGAYLESIGANPYSGKWNIHEDNTDEGADQAIRTFRYRLHTLRTDSKRRTA